MKYDSSIYKSFFFLFRYPTQPILEVESEVNFGNLVANSKTISKEIALTNHGSKSGEFKIKYSGDKPIVIMPSSGSVPPKSVQLIKVSKYSFTAKHTYS